MTNDEIRELIAAYEKLAAKTHIYSYSITQKAYYKAQELKAQLVPEEPKEPEKTGIDKWFKTK